ncbi:MULTISPECIES: lysophospholipid acyltransferase family protein [unclassified Limnothrix]|uniref:lysophospholipid acyltransferase family protein n=1 Tax=unclassified Limnothrix TaxID=2632864 RepID=UPI0018F03F0C|nr:MULTISPECIES: lysophospholipid acyltransferase family protein [unclassified Limnothrix]
MMRLNSASTEVVPNAPTVQGPSRPASSTVTMSMVSDSVPGTARGTVMQLDDPLNTERNLSSNNGDRADSPGGQQSAPPAAPGPTHQATTQAPTHPTQDCQTPTHPTSTHPTSTHQATTHQAMDHVVDSGSIRSCVLPWLARVLYPLARRVVLPTYFGSVTIEGLENLPQNARSLLFAPTHRSRWDALVVPCAIGRPICPADLHFMVSANEASRGLQGWFIQRMGGFPVDTTNPSIASVRHGIKVLETGKALVIFPEGDIFRDGHLHPLKPGLARMAIQAERSHSGVHIVPIHVEYGSPEVGWRCGVRVMIGRSLPLAQYLDRPAKVAAPTLTQDLADALNQLAQSPTEPLNGSDLPR